MNQKTVGLTLRALIIALALILAASPGLPLLDGVAYAQLAGPSNAGCATRPRMATAVESELERNHRRRPATRYGQAGQVRRHQLGHNPWQ